MTFATHTAIDITPAGLATQINALLAPFITGSSLYITQVSVIMNALQRRGAAQYQCTVTTSTAGSPPSLATPFTLQFIAAKDASSFDTETAAALLTTPFTWASGFRVISDVRDPALLPQVLGWCLANATSGAGANYTPS